MFSYVWSILTKLLKIKLIKYMTTMTAVETLSMNYISFHKKIREESIWLSSLSSISRLSSWSKPILIQSLRIKISSNLI